MKLRIAKKIMMSDGTAYSDQQIINAGKAKPRYGANKSLPPLLPSGTRSNVYQSYYHPNGVWRS